MQISVGTKENQDWRIWKSERRIWISHLRNFFDRVRALALKQVHVQKAKRRLFVRKKIRNCPGKWRKL